MIRRPIGLLVMVYGGPQSLDDLPGYLADIRRGRPTPRAILDAIAHNYRAVGGTSPLLATRAGRLPPWPSVSGHTVSSVTSACVTGRRGSRTPWHAWSTMG